MYLAHARLIVPFVPFQCKVALGYKSGISGVVLVKSSYRPFLSLCRRDLYNIIVFEFLRTL